MPETTSYPLTRRAFCEGAAISAFALSCGSFVHAAERTGVYSFVAQFDCPRIIEGVRRFMTLAPATITAFPSTRSSGGLHDFFSLANYFWPNSNDPDGPYFNRDGRSNPANFNDHRRTMIALSIQVPTPLRGFLPAMLATVTMLPIISAPGSSPLIPA